MKKVLLLVLIMGCSSYSTKELEHEVKISIIEEWKNQSITGITITEFSLTHKGGNEYRGLLYTNEVDEVGNRGAFTYTVDVICDGKSFLWEILPY